MVYHDLFRWFWNLDPIWIVALNLAAGPIRFYLIELVRSRSDPDRPPYGLSALRWAVVVYGDGLVFTITFLLIREYYARVIVPSSFATDWGFSVISLIFGGLLATGFIWMQEINKDYPPGHKVNLDRVTHFIYFWVVSALLFGFLRTLFYGQETVLWVSAFVIFIGGYGLCVIMDTLNLNPLWRLVAKHYPDKTGYIL